MRRTPRILDSSTDPRRPGLGFVKTIGAHFGGINALGDLIGIAERAWMRRQSGAHAVDALTSTARQNLAAGLNE
jgi:hypothetical protein